MNWEELGDVPIADPFTLRVLSTYSVNIVGGVPQMLRPSNMPKKDSSTSQSMQSLLRKKDGRLRRLFGGNRRISCKDLGHGDCQGWLNKRKDGPAGGRGSNKWTKYWFVLKERDMYFYKSQDDERAKGIIHLPGFQIKPAPEIKSKKHAFKAEHSGTSFYFASDRPDDMAKWMNKMALAAIQYDVGPSDVIPHFVRADEQARGEIIENVHARYSESEDEADSTPSTPKSAHSRDHTPSTPRSARSRDHTPSTPKSAHSRNPSIEGLQHVPSEDNLEKFYVKLHQSNMHPIRNENRSEKRNSCLRNQHQNLQLPNPAEIERSLKLTSLQRTLKDRENELQAIESLLASDLSAASLQKFRREQPGLVESLQKSRETTSQSSQSEDDSTLAATASTP